jgi:hypothetical protein
MITFFRNVTCICLECWLFLCRFKINEPVGHTGLGQISKVASPFLDLPGSPDFHICCVKIVGFFFISMNNPDIFLMLPSGCLNKPNRELWAVHVIFCPCPWHYHMISNPGFLPIFLSDWIHLNNGKRDHICNTCIIIYPSATNTIIKY